MRVRQDIVRDRDTLALHRPRDVIRLMVRILAPTPGMSIYDPTCGSGGMLIITREFIEHSGGAEV